MLNESLGMRRSVVRRDYGTLESFIVAHLVTFSDYWDQGGVGSGWSDALTIGPLSSVNTLALECGHLHVLQELVAWACLQWKECSDACLVRYLRRS